MHIKLIAQFLLIMIMLICVTCKVIYYKSYEGIKINIQDLD